MVHTSKPKFINSRECYRCHKIIESEENYCTLVSHSKGKIVHQDNWCAACWKDQVRYWSSKMLKAMSLQAIEANPELKEIYEDFKKKFESEF